MPCKKAGHCTDLTEAQWQLLEPLLLKTFPPWPTVYHILRRWSRDVLLAGLNDRLRALVRERAGKDCRPTTSILDSQTLRSARSLRHRLGLPRHATPYVRKLA